MDEPLQVINADRLASDGRDDLLRQDIERLLGNADAVEIALFPEASSAMAKGPFDLSLVEDLLAADCQFNARAFLGVEARRGDGVPRAPFP